MKLEAKHLTLKRLLILASRGGVNKITDFYATLPPPGKLRIGCRLRPVPLKVTELLEKITYGQKRFLEKQPDNDIDAVLRMFVGWYYPIVSGKPFDESRALEFGAKAMRCNINELYPACAHIARLVGELNKLEERLLAAEADSTWIAAGGNDLAPYAPQLTVDFLAKRLMCSHEEVYAKSYAECLAALGERATSARIEKKFHKIQQETLTQPRR